jgi:MFS family permease
MAKISSQLSHVRQIPAGVWALGFVSLLMDVSSEMIHALLPVYLVTILGTSALTVGLIEGIAEATASITKVFSGALSDWLGKRKLLATIGYGLAAFTKLIFPLASSVSWLLAARFIDRIGKGIRGAPRDALVADIAPAHLRGASFGLRQSLDTVGAFLGPGIAIGLMWLTADNFQVVFWIAVIPAFLSFALILFAVREPERPKRLRKVEAPFSVAELKRLGSAYWWVVGVATVFSLARFSEAFLLLRAQALGLPIFLVPMVLVAMNVVYALAAYPVGVLSDRSNRMTVLLFGFALLITADVILGFATGLIGVALGVILWGLHMGFTQGLLATLVADTAPPELRGTSYGIFNLLGGIALLFASILAGALWDILGPVSYTI